MHPAIRALSCALLLVLPILLAAPCAQAQPATDSYDAALNHSGRSSKPPMLGKTDRFVLVFRRK
ncbi:MAG: hypothetical protein JSR67_14145 [Proteobacteria bacterium]|nr:hypothetical protein [Pseudomonadota bacterium]